MTTPERLPMPVIPFVGPPVGHPMAVDRRDPLATLPTPVEPGAGLTPVVDDDDLWTAPPVAPTVTDPMVVESLVDELERIAVRLDELSGELLHPRTLVTRTELGHVAAMLTDVALGVRRWGA